MTGPDDSRSPKRIQMTRQRPWRAENPDAVIVDRRTRWGNPFIVVSRKHNGRTWWAVENDLSIDRMFNGERFTVGSGSWERDEAVRWAIANYRHEIFAASHSLMMPRLADVQAELRGRDLACWCPLDAPCHADVLLELAND